MSAGLRNLVRPLATQANAPASLEGSVAWVVGGVGIIGRGICRGLLQAGATVIVSSRFEERLDRLTDDLGRPERLITVGGTMQPEGAEMLVKSTIELPQLAGKTISHVIAHNAVRWWAAAETDETTIMQSTQSMSLMKMGPMTFAYHAARLPALHHAAAQQLLPLLPLSSSSSYTFVTGGAGIARSPLDQVNTHGVWGLADALREELHDQPIRVGELRVKLRYDRLAAEKALDPRSSPLSHDIGVICAGMAANTGNPIGYHAIEHNSDIPKLKEEFPVAQVPLGDTVARNFQGH